MDYEEKMIMKIFFYEKKTRYYLFLGNASVWFYKETFKWFYKPHRWVLNFWKVFIMENVKHREKCGEK